MLSTMLIVISLILGITMGLLLLRKNSIDHWLILYYHAKYRNEDSYIALYDLLDDEFSYKLYTQQNKSVNSYAAYIRLHQRAKPHIFALFQYYYNGLIKFSVRNVIFFIVLPSLVLFKALPYFLVPLVVVNLVAFMYKAFTRDISMDIYARAIMNTLMSDYSNSKVKS